MMKNPMLLFTIVSALLVCCYADSDRMNCRENLSYINDQRDMVLTGLLSESYKGDPNSEQSKNTKAMLSSYYYFLYKKSMEKQRVCDNNLILKIFSPETDDLK